MGRAEVKQLGGNGPKVYTMEDFSLPNPCVSKVLLPDGHVFSDFACLEFCLSSSQSISTLSFKRSDTMMASGILDYRGSTLRKDVFPTLDIAADASIVSVGGEWEYEVKPQYPYVITYAFAMLK